MIVEELFNHFNNLSSALCNKAEGVYNKYATMEGCDKEELDSLYNSLNEAAKVTDNIDILVALHLLLKIKRHQIDGIIIENGRKIKYINHDSIITTEIIK